MRNLLLFLLLTTGSAASAKEMLVVVHTSDRVVVDYVCTERLYRGERNAVRQVVQATGRFDWHVVNGNAPYHVVDQYRDQDGNVCITVMDALGNFATGCGVVEERRTTVHVNCAQNQPEKAAVMCSPTVRRADCERLRSECIAPRGPDRDIDGFKEPRREPSTGTRSEPVTRTVDHKTPDSGGGGRSEPTPRLTQR